MGIDLTALGILLLFAVVGAATGGTKQLLRIGAAVAAVVFAPLVAQQLGGPIGGWAPELPAAAVWGLSLIAGATLIYFTLSLLIWVITDLIIKKSEVLTAADRALGLGLGLLKAALLLYLVGHGLLLMRAHLPTESIEQSVYLGLVQDYRIEQLVDLQAIQERLR